MPGKIRRTGAGKPVRPQCPLIIAFCDRLFGRPVPIDIPERIHLPSRNNSENKGRVAVLQQLLASAFGVLLALPRLVQADLLSLDLARVAGDESCLAEQRLESRVILDQGARKAVADRARLPEFASPAHSP
jgi:hypothetical protein